MKRYTKEFQDAVIETVVSRIREMNFEAFSYFTNDFDECPALTEETFIQNVEALCEEIECDALDFQKILEMDEWLHMNALGDMIH